MWQSIEPIKIPHLSHFQREGPSHQGILKKSFQYLPIFFRGRQHFPLFKGPKFRYKLPNFNTRRKDLGRPLSLDAIRKVAAASEQTNGMLHSDLQKHRFLNQPATLENEAPVQYRNPIILTLRHRFPGEVQDPAGRGQNAERSCCLRTSGGIY